jgi:hypothetical protein
VTDRHAEFPLAALAQCLIAIEHGKPPSDGTVTQLPPQWQTLVRNLAHIREDERNRLLARVPFAVENAHEDIVEAIRAALAGDEW